MFTTRFEAWVRRHAQRLMSAVSRLPVTPNQITVVGTAITFLAAALVAMGQLRWGGLVLAIGGTFDILDGALARSTRRSYPYGAFLDSTLDRYSEGAMYIGLAAYFSTVGGPIGRWLIIGTAAALAGSFLVSYVRARAQSLGFTCETGIFARPERVVVTVAGLLFGGYVLYGVVFLLAILTNLTALQRIREVWLQGRAQRLARERVAQAVKGGQPVEPEAAPGGRSLRRCSRARPGPRPAAGAAAGRPPRARLSLRRRGRVGQIDRGSRAGGRPAVGGGSSPTPGLLGGRPHQAALDQRDPPAAGKAARVPRALAPGLPQLETRSGHAASRADRQRRSRARPGPERAPEDAGGAAPAPRDHAHDPQPQPLRGPAHGRFALPARVLPPRPGAGDRAPAAHEGRRPGAGSAAGRAGAWAPRVGGPGRGRRRRDRAAPRLDAPARGGFRRSGRRAPQRRGGAGCRANGLAAQRG